MSGSIASASVERSGPRELVVSVNWIGDAIMAMPALQLYRQRHPRVHLVVLARGILADLWSLHAAPDEVIRYDGRPSWSDPLFTRLRGESFDAAWILPNSFRSAWIAFRAGIPVRHGYPGGWRHLLINAPARRHPPAERRHQAWESMHLLHPDAVPDTLPMPELRIPDSARRSAAERHGVWTRPVIGLIPGAARGPSKRWPAAHFAALARRLAGDGYGIALFGGPDDRAVCAEIAAQTGAGVMDFAGRTTLAEWAVLLAQCRLVLANDSGGMHLAAALGRPLIALYGMTDPSRTGPLGERAVVLQNSVKRGRDIARHSAEAEKSLASILPDTVYQTAQSLLHPAPDGQEAVR